VTRYYSQFRFWSPIMNEDAVRLSMCNDRQQEYFSIVAWDKGRRWRDRRAAYLEAVETAIDMKLEPGEVIADDVEARAQEITAQRLRETARLEAMEMESDE